MSRLDGRNRGRRRKKPTYYVRKDEMKELLQQIDTLQARVQTLQEASVGNSKDPNTSAMLANEQLRGAVDGQQYAVANVQSALGGYLNKLDRLPYESVICLGKDRAERHATLLAMKDEKICKSLRYLKERTRFLDPMTPHSELSRYVTPRGDYCVLEFDVTIFEDVKSARHVFDALTFFFFNMEISISEVLGDITIREDDEDTWHQGVFQNRIVSSLSGDIQVEMNKAVFIEFYDRHAEHGGRRPFGVIASDFVNEDELYPYVPSERARYDVTGVLSVAEETRTKTNANGEEEAELVVVLTRSALLQLHPTESPLPSYVVYKMRDNLAKWGEVMLTKTRELVYAKPPRSSNRFCTSESL